MTEPDARVDRLLQQAAQLVEAGQKDAARQVLAEALSLNSQRVDAWLLLAKVTYSTVEEIDCLKRAVALDPAQTWIHQRLSELGYQPTPATSATPVAPVSAPTVHLPKAAPTVVSASARQKLTPAQKSDRKRSRRAISPWWLLIGLIGLACSLVWLSVLLRPIRETVFGIGTPTLAIQTGVNSAAACQRLIDQALQVSNEVCSEVGPNKVCYGNNKLQATLADGSSSQFAQEGDVVDAFTLKQLSASPLNLDNNEWGIGIFKLLANLPRTTPGENVTFVVFGNTTLASADRGLEAFYFSSGAGRVACEQVPMDGITVNVPEGGGVRFVVNGAEVTLLGNAALEAHPNEEMTVSILSGSALVSSDGVDRYFGAGQQVGVPLGGANGVVASGPPSEPLPLAPAAQQAACTLSGTDCNSGVIPTISAAEAEAAVQQAVVPNPTATVSLTRTGLPTSQTPTPTLKVATTTTQTVTPLSTGAGSPTPIHTATRTPTRTLIRTVTRTATRSRTPSPTVTGTLSRTPSPTVTATPNGTLTVTRTATLGNSPTPTKTLSRTPSPTVTATPNGTFTVTRTATATVTRTATATVTRTPTATVTSSPTSNITATSTFTPTRTVTKTNTPTPTVPAVLTVTPTPTPTAPPATATLTATTAPTNTPTPTATDTPAPPTATATNTAAPPTVTPTATTETCNISGSGFSVSGISLLLNIQNNMSTTVTIASVSVTWIEVPASQKLKQIHIGGNQVWDGSDPSSPSDIPSEKAWTGSVTDRQIGASGASSTLEFQFQNSLQASGYNLTVNFDNGCSISVNN